MCTHSLTSLHSGAIDAAMVDEVSRGFWFSVLFPIRQVLSVYLFLKNCPIKRKLVKLMFDIAVVDEADRRDMFVN